MDILRSSLGQVWAGDSGRQGSSQGCFGVCSLPSKGKAKSLRWALTGFVEVISSGRGESWGL